MEINESAVGAMIRPSLGWLETALEVAERARFSVPAYRELLRGYGIDEGAPLAAFPITDKQSYLLSSRYDDLLPDTPQDIFTFFRSSGSSGQPFYWPQLKDNYRWSARQMRTFLERSFAIHQRKTLAVVAMALGSWVGGDYYSWILKNVSMEASYGFAVMSPGDQHAEVIESLHRHSACYEQLLIIICPSMIGYLSLLAQSLDQPLPLQKVRFLTMGEPFAEPFRMALSHQAGLLPSAPFMLSVYGSADTGSLGAESLASVALRQLLHSQPEIARQLDLGPCIPHFFHFASTDVYLEVIENELCVTRWQGIPLIRYNLHDKARLLSWTAIREVILNALNPCQSDQALILAIKQAEILPDLIAIWGRSDSALILGGTNITEEMLSEALSSAGIIEFLSGAYRAGVETREGRSTLVLNLEFRRGVHPDNSLLNQLYPRLIKALSRVQPEFGSDWQKIYSRWDHDPAGRILQLVAHPWPELSVADARKTKSKRLVVDKIC